MEKMEPRTPKIVQRVDAALSLPLIASILVTHDPLSRRKPPSGDGGSGVIAVIRLASEA
jgi:hypothetical protein